MNKKSSAAVPFVWKADIPTLIGNMELKLELNVAMIS